MKRDTVKDWLNIQQYGNTLEYWKKNAEEDYLKVPISVLKYITCLEETLDNSRSREEVVELITKAVTDLQFDYDDWEGSDNEQETEEINEWIEQNL